MGKVLDVTNDDIRELTQSGDPGKKPGTINMTVTNDDVSPSRSRLLQTSVSYYCFVTYLKVLTVYILT